MWESSINSMRYRTIQNILRDFTYSLISVKRAFLTPLDEPSLVFMPR